MINFNKNKLINKTLDKFYETFSHTLDTADYVPDKFNDKISKYIYKNLIRTFKQIDKEDRIYQREIKRKERLKKRSTIVKERADYFLEQKINECVSTSALDNNTSQ